MATKSIAWNTGTGNITLTYQGQGDGPISIQTDANNLGSARSQVITVETVGGAITRGFTVSQAACPFPVGDVKNFSYTGSYKDIELPAGQYKWQCWGAQGGSNAAASSYSITAKAGGKGGYSEGIITLTQKTTVRVTVGGAGTSSAGGFNGGGSTTGSSTYNASNEQGVSRMGGGGGATDIRLSDGALLSRMIVAGGGAGGAMCYQSKTTTVTSWSNVLAEDISSWWTSSPQSSAPSRHANYTTSTFEKGKVYRFRRGSCSSDGRWCIQYFKGTSHSGVELYFPDGGSFTVYSGNWDNCYICWYVSSPSSRTGTCYFDKQTSSSSTTTSNDSQVGGVGGGTQGGAYSSTYAGKQDSAGSGGAFGQGANMTATNYRYCSGAGGGGWYGGGALYSDSSMSYVRYMGGGSGWVNIAANSGNRPSGYTGLQLDSGTTYAGNTSFPNTAGTGNETGHSGNGYAKITRLT